MPLMTLLLLVSLSLRSAQPPLSAGAVTLLVTRPLSEIETTLRAALADSQPRVRAAAARALAVKDDGRMVEAVVAALGKETDQTAGAEMIRTLLLMRGRPALNLAEEHAGRIGGRAHTSLAVWVARNEPGRLVALLPGIVRSGGVPVRPLAAAAATAARDETAAVPVLRAWMAQAPAGTWAVVLDQVLASSRDLERVQSVVSEAIGSDNATMREQTVWALLNAAAHGVRLPKRLAELVRAPASVSEGWERTGRELLARHVGRAERTDLTPFLEQQQALGRLLPLLPLKLLTAPEAAVVTSRVPASTTSEIRQNVPPRASAPVSASTLVPWLPGLLPEAISASGCRLPGRAVNAVARMTFRADGRPRRVDLDPGPLPPACVTVLQALAMTTMADEDRRIVESHRQAQVLPLTSAYVGCHAQRAATRAPGSVTVDDTFQLRKIRDVSPGFPLEVRKSRIPARVTAELAISETGCVSSVRVLEGSGLDSADVAVVAAMAGWEYLPVQVGGTAVPVVTTTTITLTFR
jgi:TonB family protein